ncbi:hypothetical protein [Mesorhizobium sp. M4B.F.Ca.ET.013.02.1.1]|uniref:hypothetical protein n=1 Tax=Mesorhizobium sp. M4B.F.Ca.ET.013.02.1.1 TaxID=2496755 RepID=UPI0016738A14|nr:hypothetical protein [Mesorhizobium sp. M4B.F.Ca.ET.013.02.1.1]
MKPVSARSEAALREAAERLLAGKPRVTNGKLTVANLAREAGVGRATANRATELLAHFRSGISSARTSSAAGPERHQRAEDAITISTLRDTAQRLAQQVQYLTVQNAEQQRMIDALRTALDQATAGQVVRFPGR